MKVTCTKGLMLLSLSSLALLAGLSSCAGSGKVKDEGSYTLTGKTAAEHKGSKAKAGGSVGVFAGTVQ